jgi:hypothetical protein
MGTYKNSYTKNTDYALWELHEIRHRIHQTFKNDYLKINEVGNKVYRDIINGKNTASRSKTLRSSST